LPIRAHAAAARRSIRRSPVAWAAPLAHLEPPTSTRCGEECHIFWPTCDCREWGYVSIGRWIRQVSCGLLAQGMPLDPDRTSQHRRKYEFFRGDDHRRRATSRLLRRTSSRRRARFLDRAGSAQQPLHLRSLLRARRASLA
jgi:hypothetical protein